MIGYVFVVCAGVLWGSLGIIGKYLYSYHIDPLTVVTFRALFAFLGILMIVLIRQPSALRVERSDLPFFALFGSASLASFYSLFFYTVQLTDVATSAVLLYTAPAFVTLMAAKVFGEKLTREKLISLLLTFVGCLLVVRAYNVEQLKLGYLGIITGLGSGVTFGLYSIFSKHGLQKYGQWTVLLYSFGFASLTLILINNPLHAFRAGYPGIVWILLVVLALLPTLVANSCYTWALTYIEASRASIVSTVEPVVAAVLAYYLLGESLEFLQFLGMVLVIGGVIFTRVGQRGIPIADLEEKQMAE